MATNEIDKRPVQLDGDGSTEDEAYLRRLKKADTGVDTEAELKKYFAEIQRDKIMLAAKRRADKIKKGFK